jgi:hypothetical protein
MDFTDIRDEDEDEDLLERRRPGGCLRGLLRLSVVLVAPLALAVALAPTLMSSDPGRLWALKKVNAAVAPAEVSFDRWSLGWLTAPVLENVAYRDPARGASLQVEQVSFDRGLLRLLPVGTLNLGRVTLKNPEASVSLLPPAAQAPAVRPEAAAGKGGGFFLPVVDVAADVRVENGRVAVAGRAPELFVAQQVCGSVTLESFRKPIAMQVQMQAGGGTLAIEGRVQSLQELFKGEAFEKPEKVTLRLANVDVAAFGPLIQHACGEPWIRSGVAEGALTALISGPEHVKLEGGLLVSGLSVAGGRQSPSPTGDLALMVDASYDKKVVSISKFELSSPWLRANASGTLQPGAKAGAMTGAIRATAESDLAAVTRDFATLLGLSKGFAMQKGRLVAAVEVEADEKAVGVDATLTAADLAMTIGGEPLALKPAPSLALKASFPYGGWPEVESFRFKAPFADIYGSGRFDAAVVKGKLDLTLFSRDFKRMLKDAPPMVGSAYLDVSTKQAGGRVALNAFLKLSDVAAELRPGQRLVVPQGTLKAEGYAPLKEGRPEREIQDAAFEFTLESGRLSGGWKRLAPPQGDRPLVLRGFALTSDMELGSVRRLLGGFIPAAVQRRLTEWQGRVIANATAEAAGGAVKARLNAAGQKIVAGVDGGVWRVPDVRLEGTLTQASPKEGVRLEAALTGSAALSRDGETVFAEKAARLAVDALFAPDNSGVRFSKFELASGLLEVQAQAEVTELATRCVVDAKGLMAVDFGAVTQVLEAEGVDEFQMTGRGAREFRFASPVAGGLTTVFAEGEFAGAAYLDSFKGLGLQAGPSDVSVKLSKGLMKMAYEPALNGGKLRLVPELSVERGAATLSVPAQTRLLESVRLNQEMVDKLLVNLNPLFQGSAVQDGSVTLDLALCRLASGQAPDKGVVADMNVQFKNLKLEMGPSLLELLAMLKVKERVYSAEQLPIHVTVKEGRITVDPVRMVVDKQPVIFSGWTAFDGTIKYLVEVPLTDRVTGGTGGKLLKGMTIKIPVAGTVNEPRLDTSVLQSAIGRLLKNAVGEEAVEKIGTFLEKLQEELKK